MAHIDDQLTLLPHQCGVYRFLNKDGTVIYVGKAKDLKKRVSQYFTRGKNLSIKTQRMVSRARSLEYTVVETESDALLLENNLIKRLQPRYNILLKDDKTFPWICVKNEPFPRIMQTRKVIRDKSLYFGPYTSTYYCRQLLQLIHNLYPLRTCSLVLTPKAIAAQRYRKCLQYHIGRCKAPCVGLETEDAYEQYIRDAVKILKGDVTSVRNLLEEQMNNAVEKLNFEQAQKYKEQWEALTRYQNKSVIVNPHISNVDVFSLLTNESSSMAFGNFMRVSQGSVIQSRNVKYKLQIEETPETLLSLFLADMKEQTGGLSREILVPFLPEAVPGDHRVHVPLKGDKKKLVTLSLRNAENYKTEQLRLIESRDKGKSRDVKTRKVLEKLQQDLNMPSLPVHIECFDNSNLQGSNPVAACVVFRNGVPSNKDYRHFSIKTVEGPNDFASMKEVVTRRYSRVLREKQPLPQLVVIDGGKGQLSAAFSALKDLQLVPAVTVIGLAKRLEEIYLATDKTPLFLDKNSSSLRILMHLRNEAHRFGITFHRKKRSSGFARSVLTDVPGIGPRTMERLMVRYGSLKHIEKATLEELSGVIPAKTAQKLRDYLDAQGTGS
ncbi:MAG: excinuclease ABC subunit UvrC [Bacteroidales bacterium]|jgi:excinuclease ABC subunit C|nr:excinuclease ABC subunit UvrC [Bacteroidales bacterium]MDD4065103.1 excinuclease ABC subunit UvrC [Bacteroidales bacterium]MDD5282815.1 excinuclease ABC subunit UvrC [Bacteroidales bacterium]